MEKLWITGYRLLCYLVPSFYVGIRCTYCLCHWFIDTGINSTQLDFNSALSVVSQKLASG